jgi:outer membrane protein assembly factor BamB
MSHVVKLCSLLLFVCCCQISLAERSLAESGENWPTFRGAHSDGVAPAEARPPTEFSLDNNLKWKTAIPGQGHSSPIVWGKKIFLMSAVPDPEQSAAEVDSSGDQAATGQSQLGGGRPGMRGMNRPAPQVNYDFNVLCLDRETGAVIWSTTVASAVPHEGGHRTNTYASASPLTDGRYLWCHFGSQGIWCLDLDGNVIWNRDLGKMVTRNQFGEGASLAVHGNVAVIPWDQERNSFILAVDARTGSDLWRQERDEVTTWSTPTIVEHGGRLQVITNGLTIRSYDLVTGDLIWQVKGQTSNPIATPLIWRDRTICMTGHRGFAIQAIDLSSRGDVTDTSSVAWKRNDSAPYIASPTLLDDTIYFVKGNSGILSSVSAVDGEVIIAPFRLPGIEQMYASLVSARGNVYACGREGTIIVFKHGKTYQQVHRTDLGEPIDATPAISGNLLIIRGHQHLYCFES